MPKDTDGWTHLWDGTTLDATHEGFVSCYSPIGQPCAYYRTGDAVFEAFAAEARKLDAITVLDPIKPREL